MKEKKYGGSHSIRYYWGLLAENLLGIVFNIEFFIQKRKRPVRMSKNMHKRFKKYAESLREKDSAKL